MIAGSILGRVYQAVATFMAGCLQAVKTTTRENTVFHPSGISKSSIGRACSPVSGGS